MLWWVGFALGAPTALSGWSLSEEAWFVEDHIVVDSPEGAVHAHDAYLFRALGPDDEVAGWVTVGDLGLSVRPEGSGGVAVLDHRLRAHGEREGAVHTWSVAASRAVLFDAARPLPSGAVPVRADRGLVVFDVERSADAEEEVLVTDLPGLPAARRQALRALLDQVDRWTQQAMDPRVGTQLDQLEGRSGQRWVAAVELAADEVRPWSGGRWLSWTHDPTGIMAPGRAAVFRGADHRVLAQQRLPRTVDGRAAAARRLDLRGAGVVAAARVKPGGQLVDIGVAADLELEAVGGAGRLVVLDVPHTQQRAWYSNPPLPHGWSFAGAEAADGTPLQAVHLPLTGDQREGRGTHRTMAVVLPHDLPAGERTTLRVRWKDRRRYAHVLEIDEKPYLLDVSSGAVEVLPVVRGDDGAPAPVHLRAGVGSEIDRDDVVAAGVPIRGDAPRRGLEWTETRTTSAEATMAVGRFREAVVAGRQGKPTMEAYLQARAQVERVAQAWAWVSHLVDPVVPRWPERVALVDGPSRWGAAPGTRSPGGLHEVRATFAGTEGELVMPSGSQIASALLRDRWAAEAPVAEGELVAWLGAELAGWWALEAEGARRDQDRWRRDLQARAQAGAGAVVPPGQVGMHLLNMGAFALPEAFGEAAVRQAFTEILAGTYEASWEGLADALEAASGFEADGYVSLWMASVVRPSLDVRWRHDPDEQRLVARVLTDMPHGSLPVTLRVKGRGGVREVPMAVHDGLGRVVVPWDGPAPRRVTVDVGALPVAGTVIREEPGGARASRSAP